MNKMTQVQLYMMYSQFLFSTAIGFFIGPIVGQAGYMAWVSVILGGLIGIGIAYPSYILSMRRPWMSLGQYGHEILGRPVHLLLMAAAIFIHLYMAASILRQLTEFIVQIYLPGTPDWVVAFLFGICVVRAVRSGPGSFARSAQGLFFFSVTAVFVFPLFNSHDFNWDSAVALITHFELPGVWNGTLMTTALFGEMGFIAYVFPYIAEQEKTFKSLFWAAFTAVIVTLVNVLACVLLFGPDLTADLTYPTLELIRYAHAGVFIQNLDPLLIIFWLFSMLLKIGLFLLVGVITLTHTMGLKDHRPFSYAMGAAMLFMSMFIFESLVELEQFTDHSESAMMLVKSLFPCLYLVVDLLRGKRVSSSG